MWIVLIHAISEIGVCWPKLHKSRWQSERWSGAKEKRSEEWSIKPGEETLVGLEQWEQGTLDKNGGWVQWAQQVCEALSGDRSWWQVRLSMNAEVIVHQYLAHNEVGWLFGPFRKENMWRAGVKKCPEAGRFLSNYKLAESAPNAVH